MLYANPNTGLSFADFKDSPLFRVNYCLPAILSSTEEGQSTSLSEIRALDAKSLVSKLLRFCTWINIHPSS